MGEKFIMVSLNRISEGIYLVTLEGSGTYLIKGELKYQGFKWNPRMRRWEKSFDNENDALDMVKYLKKFINVEGSEIMIISKKESY